MKFTFEQRLSDSPLVDAVWRTESVGGGSFTSVAESHWGMVVTRQKDKIWLTVRGPETISIPAPVPEDAEFMGIVFKHGTFMPHLPPVQITDRELNLPEASSQSVWLNHSVWEFPTFENVDTFIQRLVRQEILVHDPIVAEVLQNRPVNLSQRTVQRRFLQATGITLGTLEQIERAHRAVALLEQGISIADTVDQLGYADQPHLTRSLKRFMGKTPAQILRLSGDG